MSRPTSQGPGKLLAGLLLTGALCFGVLLFVMVAHGPSPERLLRVRDGAVLRLSAAMDDLRRANLIFAGEAHDRLSHHEAQLKIIRALNQAGARVAVGLEMIRAENQGVLDRWVRGQASEEELHKIYREDWSFPWEGYRSIFLYAKDRGIPLIGLNVSQEITRQVARGGYGSLSRKHLVQIPEVECNVDEEYKSFIRRALGEHAMGVESFTHFCEAQLVWDAAMAANLLRFLARNPGWTVVVLAGSGHAWRRGIPTQVHRRSPTAYRVILPEIPGDLDSQGVTPDDADYLWLGLE